MTKRIDRFVSRRTVLGAALVVGPGILSLRRSSAALVTSPAPHVVLLGDSIFDNGAYISGGPDVVHQLRERLPRNALATLVAVDGTVTREIHLQLQRVPSDASHLVVSVGGNDALRNHGILDADADSVGGALDQLAQVRDRFVEDYRTALDEVQRLRLPTAICTIYEGRFRDKRERRIASIGLSIFNDCITKEASARGLAVIDLRLICREDEDLANTIEPSTIGGAKIATAISTFVAEYAASRGRSEFFV